VGIEGDFEITIVELFHELFRIRKEVFVPAVSSAFIHSSLRKRLRIAGPSGAVLFRQIDQMPKLSSLSIWRLIDLPIHINNAYRKRNTLILESIHKVNVLLVIVRIWW